MDNSRDDDLKKLHGVFNDPLEPLSKRNAAHRAFDKIRRAVNDRELVVLRHRLIRAQIASDEDAIDRIMYQIEEYSNKKGY